jgi:hypothetical protein
LYQRDLDRPQGMSLGRIRIRRKTTGGTEENEMHTLTDDQIFFLIAIAMMLVICVMEKD